MDKRLTSKNFMLEPDNKFFIRFPLMQGTFVMVKRLTSIYKEKVIGSSPILAVSGSSMVEHKCLLMISKS